jgi:hypothetical protein
MSQTQSNTENEDLADIFVSVTGDEAVTEQQEKDSNRRDISGENRIDEAVKDGLEDAIDGAEPDPGDPGG